MPKSHDTDLPAASGFHSGVSRSHRRDPIYRDPVHSHTPKERRPLAQGSVDTTFLLIVIGLILYGIIMAYSASSIYGVQHKQDSLYYVKRHLFFVLFAVFASTLLIIIARPWQIRMITPFVYGLSILLLLLVLVVGVSEGEAQRWIQLGPITIQPSEIAKLAVVMMLALFMSKYEDKVMSDHKFGGNFRYGVLLPGVIMGVLVVLVAAEKHISGVMIIAMIGAAVMFMGGTKARWIMLLGGIVLIGGILLISFSSYADTRIQLLFHIDEMDPLGEAWQTLQGLYAIGSGGLFGLGLGNSRQKFGFVSEPQNDYIFTIICEELGFFGAIAVLLLFVLLVWRGFKIAANASDKFSALVVYGIIFKTALQAALNIAVVTNSMPNTGISLPFFSSGGTALAIQIFEMGIVLNISRFSRVEK